MDRQNNKIKHQMVSGWLVGGHGLGLGWSGVDKLHIYYHQHGPWYSTYPQEEECAGWQNHPLRIGLERLAILVPLHNRLRISLGHTVECDGLVSGHHHVQRVLCYPRQLERCNRSN